MPDIAEEPVVLPARPVLGDLVSMPTHRGLAAFRVCRVSSCDIVLRRADCGEESWDDVYVRMTAPDITILSSEPRVVSDPPLYDRVLSLQNSVIGLKRKFEQAGNSANWSLMRDLLILLYAIHTGSDHYWFWSTVAESLENPRQVSYAPSIDLSDNDARRRHVGIAKFLKKAGREHGAPFTDEQADQIGKIFGDNVPETRKLDIEVVRGDEIMDAYRELDVPGNCMQNKSYVRWYAENSGRVGLVKIMQCDDYVGRALIWTTDSGETVVDRCYSSSGAGDIANALHKWCADNSYDYKTRQSYDDGYLKSDRMDYRVTLNAPTKDTYPYLDTFKYTSDDPMNSTTITLAMEGEGSDYARFDCTEGRWSGGCSSGVECHGCGERYHEGDIHWHGDDAYCDGCHDDAFTTLNYTTAAGRHILREVPNDDAAYCDECCAARLPEHAIEHDNRYYCDECFQYRFTYCENCSSVILNDDAITTSDDEVCCGDCVDTCVHCSEAYMSCSECDCDEAKAERKEACGEAAAEEAAEIRAARDGAEKDPVTPCQFTSSFQIVTCDGYSAFQLPQYGATIVTTPITLRCELI